MISVVTKMIITHAVLENIANGKYHHHQSRTLMTVHPATVIAHTVDAVTEAALGPRTTPDPTLLWCVVVRMVMRLGVVHPAPTMLVSLKGTDMVDQGMWEVNLEL